MASIGTLTAYLTANTGSFNKGMAFAESRMGKFGASAASIAKATAAITAGALATVATKGIQSNIAFEEAMTNSLSIMGEAGQEAKGEMADLANELATKGRQSATQLAESYFFLASAGLDVQQQMKALSVVQQFATAGNFDMATATDQLTDAQSALGLSSKDANENMVNMIKLSDVLVKANTMANASVSQFATALTTKAATAIRNLNKPMEEGIAVLAAFADQGVKAQEAGTALNIVFRDLQSASTKNEKAWRKQGLAIFDNTGKMRNTADIVADLETKFEGLDDKQKKLTLSQLGFQDRSQSFILTLIGMSDKIRMYEDRLKSAGGTTKDVADKQLDSLGARMAILSNKFDVATKSLTEGLLPAMEWGVDLFSDISDSILNATKSVGGFWETWKAGAKDTILDTQFARQFGQLTGLENVVDMRTSAEKETESINKKAADFRAAQSMGNMGVFNVQ